MSANERVSPSSLSDAHDKAGKQLGTFSGLLIAWELLAVAALSLFVAQALFGIELADLVFDTTAAFLLTAAFSLGCLLATLGRHRANIAGALPSYTTYGVLLYTSWAVLLFNRPPVDPEYMTALVCCCAAASWRWLLPLSR